MSDVNDDINTARGDELASSEPAAENATHPPGELAEGAPRGDGLAKESGSAGATPDPDELAEGGPRGDGLATDA